MSNKPENVKKAKKVARSYGLLVFRNHQLPDGSKELQYLIVRPSTLDKVNRNPYYFPKGRKNKDEAPQDAALRETLEETGISAKILAPLGIVHYRNGKKDIVVYLAKMSGGIVCEDGKCLNHDWENDHVLFTNYNTARKMLRLEFKEVLDLANKLLTEK